MDNKLNIQISQACRTCLKEISTSLFFQLDATHYINTEVTLKQQLCTCIPELDLTIVPDTVICCDCANLVNSVYNFKTRCLQTEMQIHNYIQQVERTGEVTNLIAVAHYGNPNNTKLKTEVAEATENFKDIEFKALIGHDIAFKEDGKCATPMRVKQECFSEIFLNKNENAINYNLLTVKECLDEYNIIAQDCVLQVNQNSNDIDTYHEHNTSRHKAKSRSKLLLHLKKCSHSTHKIFPYCKCSLCNYSTKHKCLFGFHNRTHLTKANYKQILKLRRNQKYSSINNKIKADIKTKPSFKNQSKSLPTYSEVIYTTQFSEETKHIENNYKCSVCEYYCNNRSDLKIHVRIHAGERPFICSICVYPFKQRSHLNKHLRTHTGEKPFKCLVCENRFSQKEHLKRHMYTHTGLKPIKCSICEYRCVNKSDLKIHLGTHLEKLFNCSVCEYSFSKKGDLNQHMVIHTGSKPFKCLFCEYSCINKTDLTYHVRIHTGQKPFKCSLCEYCCRRKRDLNQHMQVHTGERPFACSVCEYRFRMKWQLKNHLKTHTGEKPINCPICEYRCSINSSLNRHMRIHTQEKPFKCPACEFCCKNKSSLKLHIQIHTGEKRFTCLVCKNRFSQLCHLKRHMHIHTGEKPFKCSFCEYSCYINSAVKEHMRIHTGERPFVCPICEYQGRTKNLLKSHLQTHTTL